MDLEKFNPNFLKSEKQLAKEATRLEETLEGLKQEVRKFLNVERIFRKSNYERKGKF